MGELKTKDWEMVRENIKFVRQYYRLTQEEIANDIGCSRGCYQHAESKCPSGLFIGIVVFWYSNYGITPNDLLLKPLDKERMVKIERRILIGKMNKKHNIKVRKAR